MKIYLASFATEGEVECLRDTGLDIEFASYPNILGVSLTNSPTWVDKMKNKLEEEIIDSAGIPENGETFVWIKNELEGVYNLTGYESALLRITEIEADE